MQTNERVAHAYQHCQSIAKQHYENFPTASLLLKKELRPAVAAIYAFARAADDFADEGEMSNAERLQKLDDWEHQLDFCLKGETDNLIFVALADVMKKHALPVQLFRDLLTAFRMDVNFKGFESLDALKVYAKYSANPVGRLMLALHKVDVPQALLCSDAICTALQLTNFWQDFKVDLPKRRCYLALSWLDAAGVKREDLLAGKVSSKQLAPALKQAMGETQKLFDQGYGLLPYLPLRLRMQIAATLAGGMSVLRATAQLEDPINQRPALTKLDWLKVSLNIGLMTLYPNHYAKQRGKT